MAFYDILCKISGSITCLPFDEDSTPPTETILVTVTAVTDGVEGEAASVAIFTVTDLPERPYFLEASYMNNLTMDHEAITGTNSLEAGEMCPIHSYPMLQIVLWSAQLALKMLYMPYLVWNHQV